VTAPDGLFLCGPTARPARTVYPVGVEVRRAARISDCGQYRYALLRRWSDGHVATFIMLNPSTADAKQDDPTIRRCVGFARAWGCGAVNVVNLYAWRATNPRELRTVADPVGPENDEHLTRHAMYAAINGWPLVAAWGANGEPSRVAAVLALPGMAALTALGTTRAGHPRHPLYLPATARPVPWPPERTA
jgi:hypothetical protein